MAKSKRPAVITLLGVLGLVSGVSQLFSGMFVALDQNRLSDFQNTGLTDSGLMWLGIITMALGAFTIYLATSILSGQKWARVWYGFIGTLNIVSGFWLLITHSGEARWTGLLSAIVWIVVLQLLFSDKAEDFFDN